MQVRQS